MKKQALWVTIQSQFKTSFKVLGCGVLLAMTTVSMAGESQISLKNTVEVERSYKQADGSTVWVREQLKTAVPGQEVIFTNAFANNGTKSAENLFLTNPMPAHMTLVRAWGENTIIKYSVDGGQTFALPNVLTVKDVAGVVKPAQLADYTHIRWVMTTPLNAGQKAFVGFIAVVK